MPTEITVTGCEGCPFAEDYHDFACAHQDNWGRDFDTCPLKTDSITIKLKQDDRNTE